MVLTCLIAKKGVVANVHIRTTGSTAEESIPKAICYYLGLLLFRKRNVEAGRDAMQVRVVLLRLTMKVR